MDNHAQESATVKYQSQFWAGAAERDITPPVGLPLVGWTVRASGDIQSHFVRDALKVKALVVRGSVGTWALVAADVVGCDAVTVAAIRTAAAEQTGLDPDAVLVCGTHTHSGPAVSPIAVAVPVQHLVTMQPDGSLKRPTPSALAVSGAALHPHDVDAAWHAHLIEQAAAVVADAWQRCQPAEWGYAAAEVSGVASSRRVRRADGSWADPRQAEPNPAEIVSRTEIDPLARVVVVRALSGGPMLAVLVNYGSHPWLFSTAGYSAELAGEVSRQMELALAAKQLAAAPPTIIYLTGPLGDVSLIWNVDVAQVWRTAPDETPEAALARRERAFSVELVRLAARLVEPVLMALPSISNWQRAGVVSTQRREFWLPLKPGYIADPSIRLAAWQQAALPGQHRSEVQVLRAGGLTILGLPGEPFASLGLAIRAHVSTEALLIAAPANDYGAVSYLGPRAEFEHGGYELTVTPAAPGSGERLIEQAAALLQTA